MTTIQESARQYEDWLRNQLRGEIVEKDLDDKHDKMKGSPFVFLRATYWRWAETIFDICPDLAAGPQVLAVGDIHLENFGTWRDADGRLAWGVNDFDEAAEMPYALDLVRLAASAMLAQAKGGMSADDISAALLKGYVQGLKTPCPVVLDRDYGWLRDLVVVPEKERTKFWQKMAGIKGQSAPERYRTAIAACMPEAGLSIETAPRSAGTGSLGRPRFVGAAMWQGAPIFREAKALVMSAWSRAHDPSAGAIRAGELPGSRYRPVDPWYRINDGLVVRRLSPNNRKIEAADGMTGKFSADMLQTMGLDLANVHLGCQDRGEAIKQDLAARKKEWLATNVGTAAEAITKEYAAWKAG